MIQERDIKASIRKMLRSMGWKVYPIVQMGYYCHTGLCDYFAVRAGVVLFIEVKSEVGRLSPDQKKFRREIEEEDCNYILARDVDDVLSRIEQLTGERIRLFA